MAAYSGRGLHGQTVEAIAAMIFGGEYEEGDPLDVVALQDRLGVSSTALREAMKVLTAKGLIEARPKLGTHVRARADWNLLDGDVIRWKFAGHPDPGFLRDLHELRSIVEPSVARLAALRRTPGQLDDLRRALDRMRQGGDPVAADLDFHRALLAAGGNELLVRMDVVMGAGLAGRDRLVHASSGSDDPVPSHLAVLEAITRGDASAAESAMRELLAKAWHDVEELL
ncbi:FadR/GntR family transcriptional regulator [Nonomuraea muscovyensis]|uniref:DNA-binding FadR family transcriptional regulator n=1 Tax=Nonomuraea muscovyensis TaxID=1124761 RepID=A0A7X0C529_9ACTN|nr:FadR/GntR family transcriptional regulator [Nonomuraea muscovyensis]MBB6348684.1 DNA-binding FadR family transcriptional regulator [Nonomuraea muscovyensis]MDF2705153.1 GntR family transcriptional regulator [Nonomuraea muscovyensis]